ncbi:putative ArsR family transcriptional regulator [Sporomusaceae bacterium BoRhaA]|uniref:L-2-amino-thiazoline-4-carboxylic acid hydrolase n=1 Tax=Pelorhabdus rhamnosifermentans TaxID=2772457 RepID=UPI001C05F051|nr:L-2-amino-thiazoline-4-carboxylic acid hydrolase [Pelorhabdus rhamnosifermentans]MBU2701749.1 putative ArsR family transcriptional regulator [Pelorhabdus rhamnosifermentans]
MIDNKISIKGDPIVDIQRGAIGHRATWTGLTYTKARAAGKAEEAEKIIREAIVETGKIQGAEIKSNCQKPENVTCFVETFLTPNVVKTFEVEFKTKTEDKVELEFHHCPLLKAWQDLGFDDATCEKLCDMAMDGDRSIAKTMGFEFYLGDTIANGGKTCQMSYSKKTNN